jgi:uncharacterized membrane protein YgdD (TMEM256/DUF423 family)
MEEDHFVRNLIAGIAVGLVVIAGLLWCMAFGVKSYARYQRVQDAHNEIAVNAMRIQQTAQLVEVEKQKAAIRVADAEGIAAAQHIINATLTDRYLQHEAISAQLQMAHSPAHTQIYIPVGTNGIPLVKTVGPSE